MNQQCERCEKITTKIKKIGTANALKNIKWALNMFERKEHL